MAAPITEAAIEAIRRLIVSGELAPGARLPAELELAQQLGMSRGTVREAVRALVMTRVLDVRRGDGTYVTSLRPDLLLQGIGFVVDLIQGESALELVEVRRILEPAATALAATRATDVQLEAIEDALQDMRNAETLAELVRHDIRFHALVGAASGNRSLASMLEGISGRSMRTRACRGLVDDDAIQETVREHEDIHAALRVRDPGLAAAAALVHISTTEAWLRRFLEQPAGTANGIAGRKATGTTASS